MTTTPRTSAPHPPAPAGAARLQGWAAVGLAGETLFTVAWIIAGTIQGAGYSSIRDDISDLGARTAGYPWLLLAPQAAAGIAVAAFALFGLRPALSAAGRPGWTGPWLAALSAIQNVSDAIFRPDCRAADGCGQTQATASWPGQVHATVGLLSVVLLVVAPFVIARRLRRLPDWRNLAGPSLIVGVMLAAGLVAVAAPQTAAVHGLVQRAMALLGATWGILLALRLRSLARAAATSH
jgi:hypothetical protein